MILSDSTSVALQQADAQCVVLKQERSTRLNAAAYGPLWAFDRYLLELPSRDERVGQAHVDGVRAFLRSAQSDGRAMPPPVAHPTESGSIHMTWTHGAHLLAVDVFSDGSFEWFYKNRETGSFEGTNDEPEREISPGLRSRLPLFRR